MIHRRRYTLLGLQCSCGSPTWTIRHAVDHELSAFVERLGFTCQRIAARLSSTANVRDALNWGYGVTRNLQRAPEKP